MTSGSFIHEDPNDITIVMALAKHIKLAISKNIPNQTNKLTPNNIYYSLLFKFL